MPYYPFKCPSCQHKIELSRSIEARNEVALCPECGEEMKRQIALTSFVLRGNGWAKDGYSGGPEK